MRTLDTPVSATTTALGRLAADARLLLRIVSMAYGYWTQGGRVRRALREAERAGTTYWVDDEAGRGGAAS